MSDNSFTNEKNLIFTITLATGNFQGTDGNTATISNFRATADIDHAGGMMMSAARFKIYGLGAPLMNQLTTIAWLSFGVLKNTIQVQAVDGDVKTTVFQGTIINSWADYSSAPDVFLYIESQAGFFNQIQSVPPTSYKGSVNVSTIMQNLANAMGMTFENNNVSVMLQNPYFPNSYMEQAKSAAVAANIDLYLDNNTLAICPKGVARASIIPSISPQSGMIGYPRFDKIGITFETIFNPSIQFGGQIQMTSSVKQACGQWRVGSISHRLSSLLPGGPWNSSIRCTTNGKPIID
jgi:hypothetical protein